MRTKNYVGFLVFALVGAVITTLCDGIHVYTGTLAYPHPWVCGQAAWVYPGFVLVFLFMEVLYFGVIQRLPAFFDVKMSVLSEGNFRDVVESGIAFAADLFNERIGAIRTCFVVRLFSTACLFCVGCSRMSD